MGFWWHGRGKLYLLLEEEKLCFKLERDSEFPNGDPCTKANDCIMAAAMKSCLAVKRPKRRGSGANMTVAFLEDDYRRSDKLGLLDMDATIAVLHQAERLLDSAAEAFGRKPDVVTTPRLP